MERFIVAQINLIVDYLLPDQTRHFLSTTVRSKSNCAPAILKQERYPVF